MAGNEDSVNPWTEPPGIRLGDQAAAALITSFRERYRSRRLEDYLLSSGKLLRGSMKPTWLAFANRQRIFRAQLPDLTIDDDLPVLLYREYEAPPDVYNTVWRDARNFLLTRHEWEQSEAYAFPPGMEWVVAYTHEYESDFEDLILLSGRFDAILKEHR